jgi:nucleoid DNA-binding protein
MENLVKMVSEKAGITEVQARSAVNTVVSFLKDKMPAGVGSQVETFLKAGSPDKVVGSVKETVGGVLGK